MLSKKNRAFLSLGSNMGDRQRLLQSACRLLEIECGMVALLSPLYKSAAWGYSSGNWYLNQVVAIDTILLPDELLEATQKIETELGRASKTVDQYHDRPIDIDILLVGDAVVSQNNLAIPHKELANRKFVLQPLADISPELVVPHINKSVMELLNETTDTSSIEPFLHAYND